MAQKVLDLLTMAISAVSGWFLDVMDKSGATSFYLTMMFVALLFSYLLAPVLRSSGSDRAAKKNKKDDL